MPRVPSFGRWLPLLAACAALLLGDGCSHRADGDSFLDGRNHPPLPDGYPVDVFYDGMQPTRPYTPITIIRVKAGAENGPRIIRQLREEARKWGAEAVIMSARGSWSSSRSIALPRGGAWSGSSSGDVIEALGVVYNPLPPPPTPLQQMQELMREHQAGQISDEDFQARKAAILGIPPPSSE